MLSLDPNSSSLHISSNRDVKGLNMKGLIKSHLHNRLKDCINCVNQPLLLAFFQIHSQLSIFLITQLYFDIFSSIVVLSLDPNSSSLHISSNRDVKGLNMKGLIKSHLHNRLKDCINCVNQPLLLAFFQIHSQRSIFLITQVYFHIFSSIVMLLLDPNSSSLHISSNPDVKG